MFVWLVLLITARYIHSDSDVIVLNDREFEKLGCFAQDFAVFDTVLLQNRDPYTLETFIGPLLDWNAFPASLHNLLVQCANAAKDYNYIAATYYGECWVSSDETTITEFLLKPESEDCLNSNFQACNIGESCVGKMLNQYVYKIHDLLPEPVNGGFTPWSEFNECSKTCGDGVQIRKRTCTNPSPENNGLDCIGEDIETKPCNMATCPSPAGEVEWQLQAKMVCYGAKDDDYGKFTIINTGTLIGIKLVHKWGGLSCNTLPLSNFGCTHDFHVLFAIITTATNTVFMPSTISIGSYGHYYLSGYNGQSPELVLEKYQEPIKAGTVLHIWHGEDLTNNADYNNRGRSCVDVYAKFSKD